jgi:RNase H-fold protein (predicted Holliday junction resolvase)
MSRTKRKGVIDKLAAQVILQGYLDRQTFENGGDMWA